MNEKYFSVTTNGEKYSQTNLKEEPRRTVHCMNTNKLLNMSKVIGKQIGCCWSEEGKAVLDDVTWLLPHRLKPPETVRFKTHEALLPLQRLCRLHCVHREPPLCSTGDLPTGGGAPQATPTPGGSLCLPLSVFLSPSVSFCLSLTLHLSLHRIKMMENVLKQ